MQAADLPQSAQFCPPSSHAVLPESFTRGPLTPSYYTASPSSSLPFPLSLAKPFVVIHPSFLSILGPNPSLNVIASSEVELGGDRRPFAHEAGVWIEATQEVWFTSNLLRDPHARNQISKIRLDGTEPVTSSWTNVSPIPDVVTGNGATLFGSQLLFCSQGVGLSNEIPSSLTLIDPLPPYSSIPLLNNFHGRPFNSINDVAVLPPPSSSLPHPTTNRSNLHHLPHSTIFFTDPTYAFAQGYKAPPELPNQVYAFDPTTGDVRVVADGFEMPNGICFDWEGEKCYITDTAVISAPVGPIAEDGSSGMRVDGARAGTIYVYDVVRPAPGVDLTAAGPTLHHRRVFAFTDAGAPDGIKTDRKGNVYSGCGDGVQVWNSHGTLIGKILLPPSSTPDVVPAPGKEKPEHKGRFCANFCFVPGGRMVILAEDRIYLAKLGEVEGALL